MANPEWDNYKLPTRNSHMLEDFVRYCEQNPDQRFWQALRNWAEVPFILSSLIGAHELLGDPVKDTFNWEGKNG